LHGIIVAAIHDQNRPLQGMLPAHANTNHGRLKAFSDQEANMDQAKPLRDASHLYAVERRAEHAARPGFRIMELQLSPTQKVPWHSHSNVSDTFYVLEGEMRLFLQDPKEQVNLRPGEVYAVRPQRPHLVTNAGTKSLTFLVLQGVGEYDFVPLT
jgi:quercetin dioxygenase-like cupin family protein